MDTLADVQRYQLEQDYYVETLAILRGLPDVILVRNAEGRCLKVISGSHETLYRPASEMIGKTLHESFPKPQADIILSYLQRSLETRQPVRGEYTLIVEDRIVNFSAVFSPIENNSVVIITHDVTELKNIEAQLSMYALITKNLAEGICLIRAVDGAIVYTNPKFESMFGYQSFELIGENVAILNYSSEEISGEVAARHCYQQVERYGKFTYEIHNVKKDGEDFWCRATTSVLEHPEFGSVYVTVQMDITAERKHQLNLELLRSLTVDINQTNSFEAALSLILKKVCEAHSWAYGEAWVFSANEDRLQCSPAHYIQDQPSSDGSISDTLPRFRALSESFEFRVGTGLPGRVYQSQQPEWQVDVTALPEDLFLRRSIAVECGIKTGLGIPLIADCRMLAVLVFFKQNADEIDLHLMTNLSAIASQLGLARSHRQLEEKLTETHLLAQAALDCAHHASLIIDKNNRIQYLTAAAQTLLDYPAAELKNLLLSKNLKPGSILHDSLGNEIAISQSISPIHSSQNEVIGNSIRIQAI